MRLNMEEAARLAKVDFTVQILYNTKLKPTHVFAGDVVQAHHAACRVAVNHYSTPTAQNADIAVVNSYPLTAQAGLSQQWIGRSLRAGGTGVLIVRHPLTLDPVHYVNQMTRGLKIHDYFMEMESRRQRSLPNGTQRERSLRLLGRRQSASFSSGTRGMHALRCTRMAGCSTRRFRLTARLSASRRGLRGGWPAIPASADVPV